LDSDTTWAKFGTVEELSGTVGNCPESKPSLATIGGAILAESDELPGTAPIICEENGGIKEGLLSEGEVNEGIILFETVDI
jgi:hypothetical protein